MNLKKWLSVAAIVVLSLALIVGVACGGGEDEEEGVKEVKFGVGAPLSGIMGAILGVPTQQGFELANDYIGEFTVAGESYKWNLIFEDNKWSSQGGVASTTKLIMEDGVKFVTHIGGDSAMSAQTMCEESGVILFAAGIPVAAFGPDKPHTFQPGMAAPPTAAALFKYVSEARPEVKTAAAASDDSTTSHMLVEAAEAAAKYFGLEWLGAEYFPPGTTELYPLATKMVSKDPDICFTWINVVPPMREMGWEGISCFADWATSYGEGNGWENFEGHLHYYPSPFGEGLPEAVDEIAAEYEQQYDVEFPQMAFQCVVQLYWLTDALKKAGTVDDVDQIIATLETEDLDTPMGPVRFGLEGIDGIGHQLMMPYSVGEIRGGEYYRVFEMSIDEGEALVNEIWGQ
jgi:branched-chain amino acid transport system substrate-binding protein